ncbi:hypothetical protein MMC20_000489 [Loxospora ochrophaea]|nr:hypothetical protein [Loxospora ochrophaea]
MSTPGATTELLGRIAYEFSQIQPLIPTYLHLILSALFPIYTGAHASLGRPASAAEPPKRKKNKEGKEEDDEDGAMDTKCRMEGLSPIDAVLYPVLLGCMLTFLYFLIKWLKDPEILNRILNWYMSTFGVFLAAKLITDCIGTASPYLFPSRYCDDGSVWEVNSELSLAVRRQQAKDASETTEYRPSPLPGRLSRLRLPASILDGLWTTRKLLDQPILIANLFIQGFVETDRKIGLSDLFGLFSAFLAVLYFNLIDRPWWLTNLLGFSFSYGALQLMTPTTFNTGSLVLSALFFYDIYFVFYTPFMVTVAKNLDIPVKLVFPRPPAAGEESTKALAMLGLGDIVLPGIVIGMALRFDLYLFYLRKQTRRIVSEEKPPVEKFDGNQTKEHEPNLTEIVVKASWSPVSGGWGERFWLGSSTKLSEPYLEGRLFPKTYFHAGIVGYLLGMLCTLGAMHVYAHGQPALLYLVPSVLVSLWMTAFVNGDIREMWSYSESDEEGDAKKLKPTEKAAQRLVDESRAGFKESRSEQLEADSSTEGNPVIEEPLHADGQHKGRLLSFSIYLSNKWSRTPTGKDTKDEVKDEAIQNIEEELRLASEGELGSGNATGALNAFADGVIRQRPTTIGNSEPAEKRQRRE